MENQPTTPTFIKENNNPSKIYLNSLVANAHQYYNSSIKPLEAVIIDASFLQNDEEVYVVNGLWGFYNSGRDLKSSSLAEMQFINDKYKNIALNLVIRENESKKISFIKLNSIDLILDHLAENKMAQESNQTSPQTTANDKYSGANANKKTKDKKSKNKNNTYSPEERNPKSKLVYAKEADDFFDSRDSCLPLINRPIYIYRQAVNGQDVIGFMKKYLNKK